MNDNMRIIENLLEQYPHNMQPKDVAEFLNLSLSSIYNLLKHDDFPSIQMPGSRIYLIPKHKFIPWYQQQFSETNTE
ncbi:MAG: helix-turn-helix domain-containing protein [Oscillospiraceae bacterium]|nr:helix-turn-helix domain-containing protein [Oscillospiraceae bacterium]